MTWKGVPLFLYYFLTKISFNKGNKEQTQVEGHATK